MSPDRLRVLLHPMSAAEIADDNMTNYDGTDDVVIWGASDMTEEDWREGNIVYTHDKPHKVIKSFFDLCNYERRCR